MSKRSDEFVVGWVSEHVQPIAGLTEIDPLVIELDRLAKALVAAAKEQGIDRDELEETTGDLEHFIESKFEHVHNPGLGSKGF